MESTSGTNTLFFDERPTAKYRYKLNGEPVPGVTTFLKQGFPTPEALISWKVKEGASFTAKQVLDGRTDVDNIIKEARLAWKIEAQKAAGIGTITHKYAHLSVLGKHEEALEMLAEHEGTEAWQKILNCINKFDEWNKGNKDEIVALETIVASPCYEFAGTFDRLIRRDGRLILTDYKTSGNFYVEQFIQDAMYSLAIEEWLGLKVEGYEVVRFDKENGDAESLLITDESEMEQFRNAGLRCLENYSFIKRWGKDLRFKYK